MQINSQKEKETKISEVIKPTYQQAKCILKFHENH